MQLIYIIWICMCAVTTVKDVVVKTIKLFTMEDYFRAQTDNGLLKDNEVCSCSLLFKTMLLNNVLYWNCNSIKDHNEMNYLGNDFMWFPLGQIHFYFFFFHFAYIFVPVTHIECIIAAAQHGNTTTWGTKKGIVWSFFHFFILLQIDFKDPTREDFHRRGSWGMKCCISQ